MKPATIDKPNAWIRLLPLWHAFFFITLGTTTVISFTNSPSTEQIIYTLLLTALLGAWYGLSAWWFYQQRGIHAPYILAYFVVGWIVWFALTNINLVFMFMLFALFPHVFMSLPLRWASGGAAGLMCLVVLRQSVISDDNLSTFLLTMSLLTIAGIVIARFTEAIISESIERQQLITTLESTRHELADAERQAGVLQERQRLAGEIHDTLAQGLTSIVMHLEAAEGALNDTAAVQQHIDQARTIARASLTESRRVMWGLRPEMLEKQAFEQAIQQSVREWSASNKIAAETSVIGTRTSLSYDQEIALLRVLQEALTNVAKHAHAQHVNVTLSYMPNAAVIDIHDDGVGFDSSQKSANGHNGFGLLNMRQRIEQMNGTLTLESSAGDGTTLVAEIPLA
jgi:signal transduction histidine kinase